MDTTASDASSADSTATAVVRTVSARSRRQKLSLRCEAEGVGQLLPNAREARARQAHAADIAQASGRGREFTRKLPPLGRDGHLGCAWSWLLWRALSLKRKSMAPCLWAVASAVA